MLIDETLRKELIRDEGLRLTSYKDTQGQWTIGVGHLLGVLERMSIITNTEAMALLESDISIALDLARACIPRFNTLDSVRQRALVNMAFNRGEHMRTSSTITPAINRATETGNWKPVIVAISSSPWKAQVGARAYRIAYMLENARANNTG